MREEEIRPEKLFSEYLLLAEKDSETYFQSVPFDQIPCPACGNTKSKFLFQKSGFNYEECPKCGSLYANPRPHPDIFMHYYSQAPSIEFWATHFYKQTEESRRKLLIKPKALHVKEKIERYITAIPDNACIIDIGAGYGVFCEELQKVFGKKPAVIAVEPSPKLQEICRQKKVPTIGKFCEDIETEDLGGKNIIAATSFELLEHLADPNHFLDHCKSLLPDQALLILTTLNWNGFELQILRERSKSIQPPAHINFFTTQSVRILLERNGFRVCDVTTPGKLDVDIVAKQISDVQCDFVRKLLTDSNDTIKEKFQNFLQDAHMSSHMMVVAQKRG